MILIARKLRGHYETLRGRCKDTEYTNTAEINVLDAARTLRGCCKDAARMLQGCYEDTARTQRGHCEVAARMLNTKMQLKISS